MAAKLESNREYNLAQRGSKGNRDGSSQDGTKDQKKQSAKRGSKKKKSEDDDPLDLVAWSSS